MVTIIGKYKFKRTDNGQVIDNEVIRENIRQKIQYAKDKATDVIETFRVDSGKLSSNRERIDQLRAERDRLLSQFFSKDDQPQFSGLSR